MIERLSLLCFLCTQLLQVAYSQRQVPCPLSIMIPFQDQRRLFSGGGGGLSPSLVTEEDYIRDGMALFATALMAVEDFNARSSVFIPAEDILNYTKEECPIIFPLPRLVDSERTAEAVAMKRNDWLKNITCAVIGPSDNLASQQVATDLVGTAIPSLTYGSRADLLANASYYPNIALALLSFEDMILNLFQYLEANRRTNLAVLYTPGSQLDNWGSEYLKVWDKARKSVDANVLLSLMYSRNYQTLYDKLRVIRSDAKKLTIVVALDRDDNLEVLAQIANDLDMLSDRYMWIFLDSFLSPQHVSNLAGKENVSPAVERLLLRGRFFQPLDGLFYQDDYSAVADSSETLDNIFDTETNLTHSNKLQIFQREWNTRGPSLVDTMNSIFKSSPGMENYTVDDSFITDNTIPPYGASILYDSIFAAGLTACTEELILNAEFHGASGMFRFVDRSRDPFTVEFGIYQVSDTTYQAKLVEQSLDGGWRIYTPPVPKDNYITTAMTVIGFLLASIAVVFTLVAWYFVFHFKKNRIVSVGQPEFLYIVCFGALLIGLSIYFRLFDEEDGWNQRALNASCTTQVWLRHLGELIIYMALYSKLWRVEKVTQIRRGQRIEVHHVLGPFAATIIVALGILVSWTIVSPPTWERTEPDVDGNTFASCTENLAFSLPLDIVVTFSVVICLWMSYKTKHLPEDISDSRRVFQTLAAQFAILMIGFLLTLVSRMYEGYNFGTAAYIIEAFGSAVFSIAFLILPKIYYVYIKETTGQLPPSLQRGRTRVTGLGQATTTARMTSTTRSHGVRPVGSVTASSHNPAMSVVSATSQTDHSSAPGGSIIGRWISPKRKNSVVSQMSAGTTQQQSQRSFNLGNP